MLVCIFLHEQYSLVDFSWWSTSLPRSFSAELLPTQLFPCCIYMVMGVFFLPNCRTFHLPLLNCTLFLSGHHQFLGILWNSTLLFQHTPAPHILVLPAIDKAVCSLSFRSLLTSPNTMGPRTDQCRTLLNIVFHFVNRIKSIHLDCSPSICLRKCH